MPFSKFMYPYKTINVPTWKRREHYEKWKDFEEPFHGVTVILDLTKCYNFCIKNNYKIFDRYLYHFIHAVNKVEAMKYRIIDNNPVIFEEILTGLVIMKPNDTFAYGFLKKENDFQLFSKNLQQEKQRVINRGTLHDDEKLLNIIHFSVLPWVNFVSLSHARKYSADDSIPKITFGKIVKEDNRYKMAMSVHVHHALVDGKDVGTFINVFQELLNE